MTRRRGFTLLEAAVSILMLSVLTAVSLRFFAAATDQRREVFQELTATQEAANLLEQIEGLEWNDLTTEAAAKFQLSAQAIRNLPDAQARVSIGDTSGVPPARKLTVSVHWRSQVGEPLREVRLVAWRYKRP
jgi:type II secretory pathway pseudopilin PulG